MKNFPYSNPEASFQAKRTALHGLIGQQAIALTRLAPNGLIFLHQHSYAAVCHTLPIPAQALVTVIGVSMNELVVQLSLNQKPMRSYYATRTPLGHQQPPTSIFHALNLPELFQLDPMFEAHPQGERFARILQLNELGLWFIKRHLAEVVQEGMPTVWQSVLDEQLELWEYLVYMMSRRLAAFRKEDKQVICQNLMLKSAQQFQSFHEIQLLWSGKLEIGLELPLAERDLNLAHLREFQAIHRGHSLKHQFSTAYEKTSAPPDLLEKLARIETLMNHEYVALFRMEFPD
ncbi:MAG: NfeD family protein [Bacteroidota bacterium]